MIEILKLTLFILLYITCGLIICYIYKAIEVLDADDSNKWKWDDEDPTIVMLFPFVLIFYMIPMFIKNIIAIPIIAITEIIRAKRNMEKEGYTNE